MSSPDSSTSGDTEGNDFCFSPLLEVCRAEINHYLKNNCLFQRTLTESRPKLSSKSGRSSTSTSWASTPSSCCANPKPGFKITKSRLKISTHNLFSSPQITYYKPLSFILSLKIGQTLSNQNYSRKLVIRYKLKINKK